MKQIAAGVLLALALPLGATAQGEHEHGQTPAHAPPVQAAGGHEMGMMGGMGMMEHAGPMMILRLRESLALTTAQIERLEALHATAREEMHGHMQAAQEARRRAHAAMQGDAPDLEAHERALREAADHTVLAQQGMARAHVEAAGILQPEQRERLNTITAAMREMHGGMQEGMRGGMERAPMHDRHERPQPRQPSGGAAEGR